MRLAWYAGASTALAAAVVTSAFYQRANFYSAMVYLSESNLCLMILVNIVFLLYGSVMYGLQRLCFGQLRPVEVEQLCDKAWFAVTETCLAMTVFREEVGGFFLVMFTALITGKVWGWIGEGRVEVLEQQPPANPRLFHTRLTVSLVTSVVYNFWLLHYSVQTVVQQARPNMMVMFLFEFAVLAVCSVHTALRYIISLVEARVVKKQTQSQLDTRRSQAREQRAEIIRRREAGEIDEGDPGEGEPLPSEDDIDEMDIEVPGWESKGQWVLFLDLLADFVKLGIYATFFFVLLMFYGLPIHIMRDLFMTTRSFVKRLGALLRYRQALKDMNKYPDATEEELSREDTCIICREEMRPWDPTSGQVERTRPKKLPCGHILHFGCLKSWLERQQVCPTCRSSVVMDPQPGNRYQAFNLGQNRVMGPNQPAPANGQPPGLQDAQLNGQVGPGGQQPANNRGGIRMFNFGPIRLGFAQGGAQEMQEMAQRMGVAPNIPLAQPGQLNMQAQQGNGIANSADLSSMESIRARLAEVDNRIQQEIRDLHQGMQSVQTAQHELEVLNLLIAELARVRQTGQHRAAVVAAALSSGQSPPATPAPGTSAPTPAGVAAPQQAPMVAPQPPMPQMMPPPMHFRPGEFPMAPRFTQNHPAFIPRMNSPTVTRHGAVPYNTAIPAGSPELPEGVVIPPGWTLLPLQRMDGVAAGVVPQPGVTTHTTLPDTHPASSAPSTSVPGDLHPGVQSSMPSSINGASGPHDGLGGNEGQTETIPVAAPTPVMPNWGGSAQLFGGNNAMPFGLQPSGSSRSVSGHSETTPAESNQGETAGASDEQVEASASLGARAKDEHHEEQANGSSSVDPKGKAPAASVEDVDDDDAAA